MTTNPSFYVYTFDVNDHSPYTGSHVIMSPLHILLPCTEYIPIRNVLYICPSKMYRIYVSVLCLTTIPRIHTMDRYNDYMPCIYSPYTYHVQISSTNTLYKYLVLIPCIYTMVPYTGIIRW